MPRGRLYLIPVPLGEMAASDVLPASVCARAQELRYFVAENARSARAFLKSLPLRHPVHAIEIHELNAHTPAASLPLLLAPALAGDDLGLLSEAGCPAVADPGAALVALAHREAVRVVPMVGPSSLLLALMASGLCGQNFAFQGYLPSRAAQRLQRLRELEALSRRQRQTQIFIEAPYRNRQLLESLLSACANDTQLCIASDLTRDSELILTRHIGEWQIQTRPDLHRRPTVFLLLAQSAGRACGVPSSL